MPEFVPVRMLKKEPVYASFAVSHANHCAMHVLLEEMKDMGDVDALVVGVGECAYYSRKIPFEGECRCWAYQLEDREIIFGDLAGVDAALARLAVGGRAAVCILTCIPSLTHLAVRELIAEKYPSIACVEAPSFQGVSPSDHLGTLYRAVLCGTPCGGGVGQAVWEDTIESLETLKVRMNHGTHIVRARKFLGLLYERERAGDGRWLDDFSFHSVSWYREHAATLGLSEETLMETDALTRRLTAFRGGLSLRGPFAYEFARYLHGAGARINRVSFGDFNGYAHERCLKLPGGTPVSPENAALDAMDNDSAMDFTAYTDEITRLGGSEKLLFLLRRAEEICR